MDREIRTVDDARVLARAAAAVVVDLAEAAIAARGRFSEPLVAQVDWPRAHVFWGDERCVPPDHPDSNYRMAREALLDHVPIPARNVHRIPCERDPAEAAVVYEGALRAFFGGDAAPRFDLVLLGLGGDGHTASLFPGTAAVHEPSRWVVAHHVRKLNAWRVTLTPVSINAAAHVAFIVSGAAKAGRLREVLSAPHRPDLLPAQIIRPVGGRLLWLIDAAAAAHLKRSHDDEVSL
jgi:6-phosphogluconolactonase